jgi:hypothetical protein
MRMRVRVWLLLPFHAIKVLLQAFLTTTTTMLVTWVPQTM